MRIAACALVVSLAAEAWATEPAMPAVTRFSVGEAVIEDRFSLLDPAWLLPPIESLDAVAGIEHDEAIEEQVLHSASPPAPLPPRPGGPVNYSLSEQLSAQVRYRHAYLFDTGTSTQLRSEGARSFSSRPDRDVLGLNMSWRLAGSTVGLGYQLESARERSDRSDAGVSRFLPGSEQATHSLTVGLTREWGRRDPPPIEAPIIAEPIDVEPASAAPAAAAAGDQPAR